MLSKLADEMALRLGVEKFLIHEALLLDRWRLQEWLDLFDKSCAYEVAPTGEESLEVLSPDDTLFLIHDDRFRLEQRVQRLGRDTAHSERPRSRLTHLYTNLRLEVAEAGITAWVNAVVYRNREGRLTQYYGVNCFDLVPLAESFRIKRKRVMLEMEALVPQGALSFLL